MNNHHIYAVTTLKQLYADIEQLQLSFGDKGLVKKVVLSKVRSYIEEQDKLFRQEIIEKTKVLHEGKRLENECLYDYGYDYAAQRTKTFLEYFEEWKNNRKNNVEKAKNKIIELELLGQQVANTLWFIATTEALASDNAEIAQNCLENYQQWKDRYVK